MCILMAPNSFKRVPWTCECLCRHDRPKHAYKRAVTRRARARFKRLLYRELGGYDAND